jgi:HTH-like domain
MTLLELPSRSIVARSPSMHDNQLTLPPQHKVTSAGRLHWARQYGRYGYRRITALPRAEGWRVNHKRVERIWRCEGLRVPTRQPKRGRLWLNDGSCVRLRPERANEVWAYDFVEDRTRDGRKFVVLQSSVLCTWL